MDSLLLYSQKDQARKILRSAQNEAEIKPYLLEAMVALSNKEVDLTISYLNNCDLGELSLLESAYYHRSLANVYGLSNMEDQAYFYFTKAQKKFDSLGFSKQANRINYNLYYLVDSQEEYALTGNDYLNRLEVIGTKLGDPVALYNAHLGKSAQHFTKDGARVFNIEMEQAKRIAINSGDSSRLETYHSYKGLYFSAFTEKIDSTIYHMDESLRLSLTHGHSDDIYYAYVNRATLPRRRGDYRTSIKYMLKADSVGAKGFTLNNKRNTYKWLASDYGKLGLKDSAFYYLKRYTELTTGSRLEAQNRNLAILNTREIQFEKQLETKKRMLNRSLLIAALVALVLLGIVAFVYSRSQQRKKRIVERENELLLKNQELTSIDSMVAGQAKERQRIAEDLHDNLGGLLATLKLYIENLKVKTGRLDAERDALIKKTDEILEIAYQKVRGIAHERNSGNPISQGLMPAIKEYAAQVSGAHKLVIEVLDHGDDQRIGNLAELTLFRIVQELITNVIKHANAQEVIIDFTYYDADLSIVFEDDGSGFDFTKVDLGSKGMGLASIKRRIVQLEGTMDIDSHPGKGTTILINIPL